MSGTPGGGADVSVRVGWADDAAAVARVQVATWQEGYAGLWPAGAMPDVDQVAAAWAQALARPADARQRLLVALTRVSVHGFAVLTPCADPDRDPVDTGEVAELVVAPAERGRGHGSRLLQAAADTLVADRFARAVTWVAAEDRARIAFLAGAGWAPDGAERTLALPGDDERDLAQVRLHTALA